MWAITIDNIRKTYPVKKQDVTALEGISLKIEKAELFGLIGPDGAGKTSLIRILTTLILADSGSASVDGFDVVRDYESIRKRVGYMPGRFSLYQDLTVEENLNFFASVFNTTISENYHLIRDIYQQIEPFKHRRAGKLSGGMKQKLALSCALIHRPSVLFLDEPTTGVDAVSRKEFWEMLKSLQEQGITIFVSTPYMDEAAMCDRVALIQHGGILKVNSPEGIRREFSGHLWRFRSEHMFQLMQDLKAWDAVASSFAFGDSYHVTFRNDVDAEQEARAYLFARSHKELEISRIEPGIEDCFMQLMSAAS